MPRSLHSFTVWVMLCCAATVHCDPAHAARPAPLTDRAVDLIGLVDGSTLVGVVTDRTPSGAVTIAVRRDWLKVEDPQRLQSIVVEQQTVRQSVREQLVDRVTQWLEGARDKERLRVFLESELRRLQDPDRRANDSEFLQVTVPAAEVRRLHLQRPVRRQLAIAAFQAGLENVELRSATELMRDLRERNAQPPELIAAWQSGLQSSTIEPAAHWAARQALLEYTLVKELAFEGTADVWWPAGSSAPPEPVKLLKSLLESQLQAALDIEPQGGARQRGLDEAVVRQAVASAESQHLRGFRATWIDLKAGISSRQAVVTTQFHARLADGHWAVVWRHASRVNSREISADQLDAVRSDPRVTQIMGLVAQAGIGGDVIDDSLRFGAAMRMALQSADEAFYQFRDQMTQSIDGPAWPKPIAESR